MEEPLCGIDWYKKHREDHTQAEIDALGIVVKVDNRQMPTVRNSDSKGRLSYIVVINREAID